MEMYLFIALGFVYLLTTVLLSDTAQKKIWMMAYIFAFVITAVAIFFVRLYADDTLMKVGELNWYYLLYVFGSISLILGVINLWIYKTELFELFRAKNQKK